jgi:acetyl esterase/lipase
MTTSTVHPAPPFDTELAAMLALVADQIPTTITPQMIPLLRQSGLMPPVEDAIGERPIVFEDRLIPGPAGAPDVLVTIFRREDHRPGGPGFLHLHGGGMIGGDRFTGVAGLVDLIESTDAVVVTVEYRLAPENPDPAPVEDCYAGLLWMADNLDELGVDPERLVVIGASAGGGLSAGVALLARDRKGPTLAGQVLIYPMLDDRNETVSSHQIDGFGVWDRGSNDTGWDALLGDRRKTDAVSIYAAPARATDLSGLPPTYLDAGSAEVFRDEIVAYASGIWASGGIAELHVWPGGFHGFDGFAPQAAISVAMVTTREAWIHRLLGA